LGDLVGIQPKDLMNTFRLSVAGAAICLLHAGGALLQGQIVAPPTPPVIPPVAVAAPPPPTAPQPVPAPEEKPKEFNHAQMVRVDVLMVSAPEEKLLPLLRELRDPKKIESAEQRLLEMVGRKEATLEGWPEVTTFDRVRAVSESIVEQRYPIEFELPGAARPKPAGSDAVPGKAESRLVDESIALARNVGGVVPTTFETRNTGATIEVEPIISPDGNSIELQLAPQIVRFDRFTDFPAGTTEKGERLTVSQPIFSTAKVSTTLALRDGERRLLHVGKATVERNRIDVFILGAKIIPSPAGR
jgi:hypothetical protein